ncbi:MAG: DUF4442 domain-containing protein [Gammaproteobacteria bacterium]|nr:DUF4442 domain-containing protein [Gammaproteobacteria bacterium]
MALSIGPSLRQQWQFWSTKPGGRWFFSRIVGWMAPYSGSISARVLELEPGHGVVELKDRHKVRNHLRSVHAVAMVNLAELATGLTLMNSLPPDMRGILTEINMQYHIKARGRLTATCDCFIPTTNETKEITLIGQINNQAGEVVATAKAIWLVGPEKD